jgi:hypothetical protein
MRKSLAMAALFLLLAGCVSQPKIGTNQIPVKLILNFSGYSQEFDVNVSENSTAFDALMKVVQIDYTNYPGAGLFVNKIGNVSNSKDSYWMFYVNGTLADVGLSAYLINESVVIEMRYEKPAW